jgi:hypothetical protein
MTWLDDELMHRCGCICHERIEEMAAQRHIKLWLTALSYTDELPPFFTSYGEKLDHSKPIAEQHKVHTAMLLERAAGKYPVRDCTCEPCEFVRNDVHRQFKLPGEEGYEDVAVPAKGKRCEVCDTPFESEHIWCDPCIQETIEKEKEG